MFGSQNKNLPVDLLGRYKDSTVLGKGGMGIVFLAKDTVLEKQVVIKTLPKSADNQSIVRFQKEAKAAAKLQHPNIVTAMNFGISDSGEPYLVMEYVQGKTLSEKLLEGPLDIATTLRITTEVADGLRHAHSKGVLHRDIKPSNIMLGHSKGEDATTALIIDFGIASLKRPDAEGFESTSGGIIGSPAYMAPEVGKGESASIESEIYSLGCVMFECLTGKPVYSGESALDVIKKHIKNPIPPLTESVSSDATNEDMEFIEPFVNRCLNKDPSLRFKSIDELKEELAKLFEKLQVEPPLSTSSAAGEEQFFISRIPTKWLVGGLAAFVSLSFIVGTLYLSKMQDIQKSSNSPSRTNPISATTDAKMNIGVFKLADKAFIGSTKEITDDDVINENIDGFKNGTLKLSNTNVTDRGIESLEGKHISNLDLSYSKITISSAYSMEKIKNLSLLKLVGLSQVDDSWMKPISNIKTLRFVWLDGTSITDNGVKLLAKCKNLTSLNIAGCKQVTDDGIESLQNLPLLDYISVSYTYITFKSLSKLKQLGTINAMYSKFQDKDIQFLKVLPKLTHLKISSTEVTDKGLLELGKLKSIKKIEIANCKNLTTKGKNRFQQLYPNCELIYF